MVLVLWWFIENVLGYVFLLSSGEAEEPCGYVGRSEIGVLGGLCGFQDVLISFYLYTGLYRSFNLSSSRAQVELWKLPPLPFLHSAQVPSKSPHSAAYRCAIYYP